AELLPPPPPWRRFDGGPVQKPPPEEDESSRRIGPVQNARIRNPDPREVDAINAAIFLRRPLLITGRPGVGKSALAYQISRELRLGRVLRWPISSHSKLQDGLYQHDSIGRVHDAATMRQAALAQRGDPEEEVPQATDSNIGDYIKLGPLG